MKVETSRARGPRRKQPGVLSVGSSSSHLQGRSPPTGQMPAPPAPAAWHHLQLLVILICKVEEPGHVEEELGGILQQKQDQA